MQIKNRQKLLMIVTFVAVGLFAGDKLLFTPLVNAWKARTLHIQELRVQLAKGKETLQREQSLRARWEEIRRNALPSDTSISEQKLFKAIDSWAQDSGATITAITPQWKHDADDFMTYQCRVDVSGRLSRLAKFLYDIERDPMALKLESVEFAAHDKEGQQLSLGVQLSALVLTSQEKKP